MLANHPVLERMLVSTYVIGGSYVVDPATANDIDVIVHKFNYDDGMLTRLNKFGFSRLQQGDKKYDEMDGQRIISVYEGTLPEPGDYLAPEYHKYNIIVVGEHYWPAYIGAIRRMTLNTAFYTTRDSRIDLHKSLCKQIKEVLGENWGTADANNNAP